MNINNKLLLAATLVTVMNFQSCSKYDDGPAFSLRTKKARLVGEWEVVKVSGQSSNQYFGVGYTYNFEFETDGDFEISVDYSSGGQSYSYSYSGEWEWEDGKETVEITIDGSVEEFEIKQLTNKEMILEDGSNQDWEFEKN